MLEINPEILIGVVVAALALFFDYFPGVAGKFDSLSNENKRLITVGLAILVAAVVFAGQCNGWFQTSIVCTPISAWNLFYGIVVAVAVMYGFHKATKPTSSVG
jgi:hypothetical protein